LNELSKTQLSNVVASRDVALICLAQIYINVGIHVSVKLFGEKQSKDTTALRRRSFTIAATSVVKDTIQAPAEVIKALSCSCNREGPRHMGVACMRHAPARFTIHHLLFTFLKVQAIDCNFASLNPPHHLGQVRIFYLQCITD
jgi:hypothetical protein